MKEYDVVLISRQQKSSLRPSAMKQHQAYMSHVHHVNAIIGNMY